jgi:Ca-activated chloride channel family protein
VLDALDLTFASPTLLWALVLVPAAVGAVVFVERRRRRTATRFTTAGMLPNVAPRGPGWRRYAPTALLLGGLLALLLAVARPEAALSVPRERATVVLAMDASLSMSVTDVAPDRLTAARRAARTFVRDMPARFQVGLVTFARRAQVLSQPTRDRVAIERALASLQETSLGTAIGDGLAEALALRPRASGRRVPMTVVLLSDGNNTTGETSPEQATAAARRAGVRVHTIAVGRRPGEPPPGNARGRPADARTLRAIAAGTGGRFFSAPSEGELGDVYRELGSLVSTVRERREVTAAFVGAGAVLLVAAGALSVLWFNRVV